MWLYDFQQTSTAAYNSTQHRQQCHAPRHLFLARLHMTTDHGKQISTNLLNRFCTTMPTGFEHQQHVYVRSATIVNHPQSDRYLSTVGVRSKNRWILLKRCTQHSSHHGNSSIIVRSFQHTRRRRRRRHWLRPRRHNWASRSLIFFPCGESPTNQPTSEPPPQLFQAHMICCFGFFGSARNTAPRQSATKTGICRSVEPCTAVKWHRV